MTFSAAAFASLASTIRGSNLSYGDSAFFFAERRNEKSALSP